LIREYEFIRKSTAWKDSIETATIGTFLESVPLIFPSLRIAQLVGILAQAPSLLQAVMEDSRVFQLSEILQ